MKKLILLFLSTLLMLTACSKGDSPEEILDDTNQETAFNPEEALAALKNNNNEALAYLETYFAGFDTMLYRNEVGMNDDSRPSIVTETLVDLNGNVRDKNNELSTDYIFGDTVYTVMETTLSINDGAEVTRMVTEDTLENKRAQREALANMSQVDSSMELKKLRLMDESLEKNIKLALNTMEQIDFEKANYEIVNDKLIITSVKSVGSDQSETIVTLSKAQVLIDTKTTSTYRYLSITETDVILQIPVE